MKEKLKTKYIQNNWRLRTQNKMIVKYTKSSRRKKLWKHKSIHHQTQSVAKKEIKILEA
jgi:hypothetical protein